MYNLLDVIYKDYLDSLSLNNSNDNDKKEYAIRKTIREKILSKFSVIDIPANELKDDVNPRDVYLMFIGDISVYFMVYGKTDDNMYEVLKLSRYYELANHNDLLVEIDGEKFVLEPWNYFFLTCDEIEDAVYYGVVAEDDYQIAKDFKTGRIKELPLEKRGLTPMTDASVLKKFHEKEAEVVREYALRDLQDLA